MICVHCALWHGGQYCKDLLKCNRVVYIMDSVHDYVIYTMLVLAMDSSTTEHGTGVRILGVGNQQRYQKVIQKASKHLKKLCTPIWRRHLD